MQKILESFHRKYPDEILFKNTTSEFVESIEDYLDEETLRMILHSERIITFRVPWIDDQGILQVNYGYRVQHNSALGPYKGGLRFHPSVTLDVMKFLAFEQTFKNALTGLPLGGAKGGADFDPKDKSDQEIMRFCQSYMSELYRHIGPTTDIPAGDIGVGDREIGYLFGQYKKLTQTFSGVLTGKNLLLGGALGRFEATGNGLIYITNELLSDLETSLTGKRIVVSGTGKVGACAAVKAHEMGAIIVAMNDSSATIVNEEELDPYEVKKAKLEERKSLRDYALENGIRILASSEIWSIPCDIALPCATQGELDLEAAQTLVENGCGVIAEGANKPLTKEATAYVLTTNTHYLPGKAANAGGVATSGIEMMQNAQMDTFTFEEVDARLQLIMKRIYSSIRDKAEEVGQPYNFVVGANLVGYERVKKAIKLQGSV